MSSFGLMLHHFYDDNLHPQGQGAISRNEFESLLNYLETNHNLLRAEVWRDRALNGNLGNNDVCVTLDDGLRCQYDIALPVLKERNLSAFWFVYSSVFDKVLGKIELYRYFRTVCFHSVEEFYYSFDQTLAESDFYPMVEESLKGFDANQYLSQHSIYTEQDRKFRFLRDKCLGPARYDSIMETMIDNSSLNQEMLFEKLWMDNECLLELKNLGHIVGLHSYSHPTEMIALSAERQRREYTKNFHHLKQVLGINLISVSHPCNSYDTTTLGILRDLGIKLGFRSNMTKVIASPLEFPREDHSTIMKQLDIERKNV